MEKLNHRPKKERVITEDLNEELYSVYEVADFMKLSYDTIRRMIKAGELPATKIGKQYRIKKSDLMQFIQ